MRFLFLTLLVGCTPQRLDVLPEMVIFSLKTTSGDVISGVTRLPRPGRQPELLLYPGLLAAGPAWMYQVHLDDSAVEIVPLGEGQPQRSPPRRASDQQ